MRWDVSDENLPLQDWRCDSQKSRNLVLEEKKREDRKNKDTKTTHAGKYKYSISIKIYKIQIYRNYRLGHFSCYQRPESTYLSKPRRNALNLCLLCLSWGSSPTRTWRLNKACVFGPWIRREGETKRDQQRNLQRWAGGGEMQWNLALIGRSISASCCSLYSAF